MLIKVEDKEVIIDDENHDWISLLPISLRKSGLGSNWYAMVYVKDKEVQLARLIMLAAGQTIDKDMVVDHINRNSLDNRLCNLRQLTSHDNFFLNRKKTRGTSKYIGVNKLKNKNKWQATYVNCGMNIQLGIHDTARDAAIAYDTYAITHFRNPLRLNFPEEMSVLKAIVGKND